MRRSALLAALMLTLGACTIINSTAEFGDPEDAGGDAGRGDAGPRDASAGPDADCPMMCGVTCIDTSTDPLHCGECDNACPAPANATATCEVSACGFTCNPGYARVLGECVEREAPRPISPLSTSTVTSQRPTLRWELAARSDGARVEICEDRACVSVLETIDVVGTSTRPPTALPRGVVFWRLFSLAEGVPGPSPSSTWQLYVPARSADGDADGSWGTTLDVNGDGFADVVVGAPSFGSPANGAAHVYLGGAAGIASVPETVQGETGLNEEFGRSVASAGDVDGDGFADLIVGAPGANSMDGAAFVFFGGPGSLEERRQTLRPPPGATAGNFGLSVASAGDLNGDGFADVAVGAPDASGGTVYIYHGSSSGVSTTPQVTIQEPGGLGGDFGWSVNGGGDANGDGFADLVVGAPRLSSSTGGAYVYYGGPSGLDPTDAGSREALSGSAAGERYGWSVSAGDPDGNGFSDVLIGVPSASSTVGAARIYSGGPGGIDSSRSQTIDDGSAGYFFGTSVGSAGDLNGDGFIDLVMGSPEADSSAGVVHTYLGGAGGVDPSDGGRTTMLSAPSAGSFGVAASAGDVDGDGFSDLIVGAPGASSNVGAVFIFRGGTDGIDFTRRQMIASPAVTPGFFGRSVASSDLGY